MTAPTIPTDVRAAASAIEAQMAKDDNAPDDLALAALAAADKARVEGAGDVVARLNIVTEEGLRGLSCVTATCAEAAIAIISLQTCLDAARAERDTARRAGAEAMREAAAKTFETDNPANAGNHVARAIRALPLPGDAP